jgi:hypothetical protein
MNRFDEVERRMIPPLGLPKQIKICLNLVGVLAYHNLPGGTDTQPWKVTGPHNRFIISSVPRLHILV